jgi:hypothetical protein
MKFSYLFWTTELTVLKLNLAMRDTSHVRVVRPVIASELSNTELKCLPEDIIELLTDVEHVRSE